MFDIGRNRFETIVKKEKNSANFISKEIYNQLKTKPDSVFFWSRKTEGVGSADIVAKIVHSRSSVTLVPYIKSKGINILNRILIILVQLKHGKKFLQLMQNKYQKR